MLTPYEERRLAIAEASAEEPRVKPFRLEVPDAALADLRERLKRTRFPDEAPGAAWTTGTSLGYLKELLAYWQSGFDWRAQEARINSLPQFKVPIDGVELHFIHAPGRGPKPMPLLLSHGWPGSIVEFLALIPKLTEHFTVVAPSLPGYTLSFAPGQKRFGVEQIANTFVKLMSEVLGYRQFGLQGGDWGAFISSRIAATRPELVAGLHLNYLPLTRDKSDDAGWQAQLSDWVKERSGYSTIQGTRPQTLAYGLTDTPGGLAAWIA
jgi:microsomal epoxide hydrolase